MTVMRVALQSVNPTVKPELLIGKTEEGDDLYVMLSVLPVIRDSGIHIVTVVLDQTPATFNIMDGQSGLLQACIEECNDYPYNRKERAVAAQMVVERCRELGLHL